MPTPEEFASLTALGNQSQTDLTLARAPSDLQRIDPDNPPWGVGMAVLVWVVSFMLLAVLGAVFLVPYAAARGITPSRPDYGKALTDFALSDPTAIFLQIFSTLPAHVLTVVIVWAVVTGFGKRPFWATLGWSWSRNLGLGKSIGLGIILFVAASVLALLLGGEKTTPLQQILDSSRAARYTIVFLATLTAPFAEEFVFRGLLYSALQRLIGRVLAVVLVVCLFTVVHVPQYLSNVGVIAAVGLLSLGLTVIRAVSGRLLPCFIVHLVFNGIQSVIILASPNSTKPVIAPEHAAAAVLTLARWINLIS